MQSINTIHHGATPPSPAWLKEEGLVAAEVRFAWLVTLSTDRPTCWCCSAQATVNVISHLRAATPEDLVQRVRMAYAPLCIDDG